jgi:cobalamin biosynthesis Co2+ chelatase CbiK
MIIYVDIDNTIADTDEMNYNNSKPIEINIKIINRLYDEGNIVVYWTARGTVTGNDWYDVTKSQLDLWGAKYHDLKMGKPVFDLFIDDKAITSKYFFEEMKNNLTF